MEGYSKWHEVRNLGVPSRFRASVSQPERVIEKENTHARAQMLFAPTGSALRGQLTLHQSFQASMFQKLWGLRFKESVQHARSVCLTCVEFFSYTFSKLTNCSRPGASLWAPPSSAVDQPLLCPPLPRFIAFTELDRAVVLRHCLVSES